jgi:hypothetical protein
MQTQLKTRRIVDSAALAGGAVVGLSSMTIAQTATPVELVNQQVTAVQGIGLAAAGVAVLVLGYRVGVKLFNRVFVKG